MRGKFLVPILFLIRCQAEQSEYAKVEAAAITSFRAGDFARTREILEQALPRIRHSGNLNDIYRAQKFLCGTYALLGDTRRAIACDEEDLAMLRKNRDYFVKALASPPLWPDDTIFRSREAETLEPTGPVFFSDSENIPGHCNTLSRTWQSGGLNRFPPSDTRARAITRTSLAHFRKVAVEGRFAQLWTPHD